MKRRQCGNRIAYVNGSYPCDREAQLFVKELGMWVCRECLREVDGA